jgi:hypothetical protein
MWSGRLGGRGGGEDFPGLAFGLGLVNLGFGHINLKSSKF